MRAAFAQDSRIARSSAAASVRVAAALVGIIGASACGHGVSDAQDDSGMALAADGAGPGSGGTNQPDDAGLGSNAEDGSAPAVTASSFCAEVASGLCTQLLPCCDSLDAGSDPASCFARVSAWCAPQIASPNLVFDPDAAAGCAAFYQNRTQNLTVRDCEIIHPATSNTCAQAFTGTLPPGAPCPLDVNSDNQCAPSDAGSVACRALLDGGPSCTITPYVGEGQRCDDMTAWCRPPLVCNTKDTCVLPQPLGSPCTEAADCTSDTCADGGCAPTAPIVVGVGFCEAYAITPDAG
jgi:hypothetical protein